MKLLIKFVFILTILSSCTSVKFESSQPKNGKVLKRIPEKFIGQYEFFSDTLVVKKFYIQFPSKLYENNEYPELLNQHKLYLSDSVILKRNRSNFYLNIKSKSNGWVTYLIKLNSLNNIIVESTSNYTLGQVNSDLQFSNSFEREKKTKLLLDSLGFKKYDVLFSSSYHIDPTKKQLKELIKRNLFWELLELKKIK